MSEALNFDPSFIRELLDEFWKTAPVVAQQIGDASLRGDYKKVTYFAHTLKGMCRTIGGDRLADLCENIENREDTCSNNEIDSMVAEISVEFGLLKEEYDLRFKDSDAA